MKRDLDNRDPAARLKPKRPNLAEPKSPTEVLLRDGPRLTFSGSFEIFEKPSRCGSKRTAAFNETNVLIRSAATMRPTRIDIESESVI